MSDQEPHTRGWTVGDALERARTSRHRATVQLVARRSRRAEERGVTWHRALRQTPGQQQCDAVEDGAHIGRTGSGNACRRIHWRARVAWGAHGTGGARERVEELASQRRQHSRWKATDGVHRKSQGISDAQPRSGSSHPVVVTFFSGICGGGAIFGARDGASRGHRLATILRRAKTTTRNLSIRRSGNET
jgi:hypothetical protein